MQVSNKPRYKRKNVGIKDIKSTQFLAGWPLHKVGIVCKFSCNEMTENTHTTRCLFPSDSFQRQMYLLRDDAFCCRMKNWRSFLMSGLQINKTSKLNSKICQSKSRRLNSRTREMACLKGRHMNIILKFYYTLAI